MNANQLFRPAALRARETKWLGEIVLIRPVTFSALTALAAALAAAVVAFLIWGSYTKRSTVPGQLIPDTGLVKVYAAQPGVVLQSFVAEGKAVRRGDVLFLLSSDRQSASQGDTQAAISGQIESRRASLREELTMTRRLQADERTALATKISALQAELQKVSGQIEGQTDRLRIAEQIAARTEPLMQEAYLSQEQWQQKRADALEQRNRLQALERDQMALQRELASQRTEFAAMPLRHQNQLAQLERLLSGTGQEYTESEAKRGIVVAAPEAGTATAVAAEAGQAVDVARPLVSIVPRGASLQAQLFAPSKAIGFVKPGDKVLLRYQAYPYQKFGQARGTVVFVSKTALPAAELAGIGNPPGGEPLYRITVALAAQTVPAYGQAQPLQAGMALDADVLQETRHLYEWVLEPLYSLSGKW